jgi:hypothetical protein
MYVFRQYVLFGANRDGIQGSFIGQSFQNSGFWDDNPAHASTKMFMNALKCIERDLQCQCTVTDV